MDSAEKDRTAVAWIRDGVLVDRMAENAIIFALSCHSQLSGRFKGSLSMNLERLVQWFFDNSGVSVRRKLEKLNKLNKKEPVVSGVEEAIESYHTLSRILDSELYTFEGAIELLRDLAQSGIRSYISSAIGQDELDEWARTNAGRQISPYSTLLGDKGNCKKGKGHFKHMHFQGTHTVYYVADAIKEVHMAARIKGKRNIPTINIVGFGNVITPERVDLAWTRVCEYIRRGRYVPLISATRKAFDTNYLTLPTAHLLADKLVNVGASVIITGTQETIMPNLRHYFVEQGLLEK